MSAKLPVPVKRLIDADKNYVGYLRSATRQNATAMADRRKFSMFSGFLGAKDPWKAEPDDVAAWCAYRADSGISSKTIEGDLCHLNYVFEKLGKGHFTGNSGKGVRSPSPCRSPIVRQTLRGIRALHPRKVATQHPISLDCLEALMDAQPHNLYGFRNKALLSIIWAGALRVSEALSLDVVKQHGSKGYVEFRDEGVVIFLLQSKTRQSLQWPEYYGVPRRTAAPRYCPVRLLENWLKAARVEHGPLFPAVRSHHIMHWRTDSKRVTRVLRNSLSQIGLPAQDYGVRSLRSGCIEWLLNEGVTPAHVKDHTGHSNLTTMYGYLEGSSTIENSPFMRTSWVKPRPSSAERPG